MNYDTELKFAINLARQAGDIMTTAFTGGLDREWKEDGTPLTYADTTINNLVISEVQKRFSSDGVLGEEESTNLEAARIWVCDPVDGTMPFSHGPQISTFSLALTVKGRPVLGVVYDPFMDRMFYAAIGSGAFMNDMPLQVSGTTDLKHALIDTEGLPGSSPVLPLTKRFEEKLHARGAHTTSLWSAILPCALVAAGQYTAVIFNLTKPEDGAAIKVIVEEAGGKVTDLFGSEQRYDGLTKGFVASNGHVHQQLIDIIKSYDI
jgi:myo-inositol-1(or 4)-monophosphatase